MDFCEINSWILISFESEILILSRPKLMLWGRESVCCFTNLWYSSYLVLMESWLTVGQHVWSIPTISMMSSIHSSVAHVTWMTVSTTTIALMDSTVRMMHTHIRIATISRITTSVIRHHLVTLCITTFGWHSSLVWILLLLWWKCLLWAPLSIDFLIAILSIDFLITLIITLIRFEFLFHRFPAWRHRLLMIWVSLALKVSFARHIFFL